MRRRVLGDQHPGHLAQHEQSGTAPREFGRLRCRPSRSSAALEELSKRVADSWERYNCESLLGASLTGQQEYEEAEPLVTAAYLTLSEKKSTIPAIQSAALDQAKLRVTQLYRSWGTAGEERRVGEAKRRPLIGSGAALEAAHASAADRN